MFISTKEFFYASNLISFFRLLLIIPTVWLINKNIDWEHFKYFILMIIFLGFLTDIFDGIIARKFNQISELGKLIDPLSDKILMFAVILALFYYGIIDLHYLIIIIARDFIIFTGGLLLTMKIKKVLPSNVLGKITVLCIGFFILISIFDTAQTSFWYYAFYYLSLFCIISSLIGYSIRALETLKWNSRNDSV